MDKGADLSERWSFKMSTVPYLLGSNPVGYGLEFVASLLASRNISLRLARIGIAEWERSVPRDLWT